MRRNDEFSGVVGLFLQLFLRGGLQRHAEGNTAPLRHLIGVIQTAFGNAPITHFHFLATLGHVGELGNVFSNKRSLGC